MGMEGRLDTFMVATSDFTREVFAQAFGMPEDSIIVTGQARTDRMLSVDKKEVWSRAFPGVSPPRKLFLWLPTFRNTPFHGGRSDGEELDNIYNCKNFSETTFNDILKANDAVCLVKAHPMAARRDQSNYSNLLFIDESWLHGRKISLYQLAGAADCLISDVSSIIADFMLLDRPIILLFEDIEAYKNNRGFSFNPITDFLPAELAQNFHEFLAELEAVLDEKDNYARRRSELKSLFFDHFDSGAADRILNLIMVKST